MLFTALRSPFWLPLLLASLFVIPLGCSGEDDPAANQAQEQKTTEPRDEPNETPKAASRDTVEEALAQAILLVDAQNGRAFYKTFIPEEARERETVESIEKLFQNEDFVGTIAALLNEAKKIPPEYSEDKTQAVIKVKGFEYKGEKASGEIAMIKEADGWKIEDLDIRPVGALNEPRTPSLSNQLRNQLISIGIALHNYHDANRHFPQDISDEEGNPLLSWRVQLLPFLDDGPALDAVNLKEPWDSETNKALLSQIPSDYQGISKLGSGLTPMLAPVGVGTVFGGKEKVSIRDITDGTTSTVIVVFAAKEVEWTKPEDLKIDPENPGANFLRGKPGGKPFMLALTADGAVHVLSPEIEKEMLLRLFQYNDGKVVEW